MDVRELYRSVGRRIGEVRASRGVTQEQLAEQLDVTVGSLLPGDLSAAMEQRLVREQRIEPATLLLMPHHGSAGSSSAELL